MNQAKRDTINKKFDELFQDYIYPFKTSNDIIESWPQDKRSKYYTQAGKLQKNKVLNQELNEILRKMHQKLAVEERQEERLLYKSLLIFVRIFRARLEELAQGSPLEQKRQTNEAIKRINKLLNN